MSEFYKNTNRDEAYKNFFCVSNDDLINNRLISLKKATEAYEKAQQELKLAYAQKYKENYTPAEFKNYLRYTTRAGEEYYYTEQGWCEPPEIENTIVITDLNTKNGYFEIIVGYCYELGAVVIKRYAYEIKSNVKVIKLNLVDEIIYSLLDDAGYSGFKKQISFRTRVNFNANEFIKNMYGRELETTKINSQLIISANKANRATEVIIKTAPENIIERLLNTPFEKSAPIYKLMGLKEETYNRAVELGVIDRVYNLLPFIHCKRYFNITESEWMDLIERDKTFEEDFDFYQIRVRSYYGCVIENQDRICGLIDLNKVDWSLSNTNDPLEALSIKYYRDSNIRENYTFRKYIDYVINETINQGYSSLDNFTSELDDYIRMCKNTGTKPTLFTNHLAQTHDILARNYKIMVTPEQESTFKSRYEGIRKETIGGYVIKAPTCTREVRKEGSELNHCVGSYIKRIINGETLIMFLRNKLTEDESLITFEVKDKAIVQARGRSNRTPSKEEAMILKRYAERAGLAYNI